MCKKTVVAFLLMVSILSCSMNAYAYISDEIIGKPMSDATKYASETFEEIIDSLVLNEVFTSRITNRNNLQLGEPYIVYLPEEEVQDEVYYYPIVDCTKDKIVYLIEVIRTSEGYVCNALDHMVEVLNEIGYIENECIVYCIGRDIFVENPSCAINVTEYYNKGDFGESNMQLQKLGTQMMQESFEDKQMLVAERVNDLVVYESKAWTNSELLEIKMYGTLELYRPQGQYSYNMCWASSVATVYNYLTTSVISGVQVCNRMGIGFNSGGTILDEQEALALFNIDYNQLRRSALQWGQLVQNIDGKFPIIANGVNSIGFGHAVTIYGYTGTSSSTRYVQFWNSALNSGQGGNATFRYGSGTFTNADGRVYTWETSLSYY